MNTLKMLMPLLSLLMPIHALATEANGDMSKANTIRQLAYDFLKGQTIQQAANVSITVAPLDSRLTLAACDTMQAFLPQGSKPGGN